MKTAITKITRAPSHLAPRQAASSNSNTRNVRQRLTPSVSRSGLSVRRALCLSVLGLSALTLNSLTYHTAHAALTATTANTIKGTEPYFLLSDGTTKLTSTDELLGFTIKNAGGTIVATIKASDAGTAINIPAGIRLDGIKPILTPNTDTGTTGFRSLSTAVSSNDLIVADGDGDASAGTSALGKIRVNLKQDGVAVTPSAATFTACANSYTLDIAIDVSAGADKITALTTYGDPNKKEYTGTTTSVTYTLLPQGAGFCRIQTGDMTDKMGFNAAVWDTGKGFSVPALKAAGKDFPTTGFKGAVLTFIGSGTNQGLYQCDISGGSWASKGGINGCTLTYTSSGLPTSTPSLPTAGDDIKVTLKTNDAAATPLDSYTLKAPTTGNWAEGDGTKRVYNIKDDLTGTFTAANYCSGTVNTQASAPGRFFSYTKLTNGSAATYFKRDADGTFMGEWGWVSSSYTTIPAAMGGGTATGYANSPWSASGTYWGAENSGISRSYVNTTGDAYWTNPSHTNVAAVCKR